jgi:hypothetical protein
VGKRFGMRRAPLGPHARKAQVSVVCRPRLQEFVQPVSKLAATRRVARARRDGWRARGAVTRCAEILSGSRPQSLPQGVPRQKRGNKGSGKDSTNAPVAASLHAQWTCAGGGAGTCGRQSSAGRARLLCCPLSAQEGFRGNGTTSSGTTPPEMATQEPCGRSETRFGGGTAPPRLPFRFGFRHSRSTGVHPILCARRAGNHGRELPHFPSAAYSSRNGSNDVDAKSA